MDTNTSLLAKGVGLEQKSTALSFSVCTGACQIKCLLLVLAAGSTLGVHIKNFHFDITPLRTMCLGFGQVMMCRFVDTNT